MTLSPTRRAHRAGGDPPGTDLVLVAGPDGSRGRRGQRRAPARHAYLAGALTRCLLYLGPLAVVVAAARPLGRVAWPVPLVVALLGWSAAQALSSLGAAVARTAGPAAAARLVAGGFAAATGLWAAFVWVAPAGWLGPSRILAGVLGVGGLTTLATVTAALVTRSERAVIRWSLPCWLLAAVTVAGWPGGGPAPGSGSGPGAGSAFGPAVGWAAVVPVETLLPAAIVVAAVRAYRPVIGRSVPGRAPLTRADRRRCAAHLIIGTAQVAAVALLWRAVPATPAAPWLVAVPLLLSVPLLETLTGRHSQRTEAEPAGSRPDRGVAMVTVAALVPPLAFGLALTAAAYRLPDVRTDVLALAAATLLGGVLAVTRLLAARGRAVLAATCAVVPPAAMVALPLLGAPMDALTAAAAGCAATHLLGLPAVAHTPDHRRTP